MALEPTEHDIVYLDYNATTPCDPRVVEVMLPWFANRFGNPANGLHLPGREASRAVTKARENISELLNCMPTELIFTSGATESNNLAILGLARAVGLGNRQHIVTSAIEHKSVLLTSKALCAEGFEVSIIPVDRQGRVSIEELERVVSEKTLLVSVQAANNEIGTLQDMEAISAIAHRCGAIFHTDAAQAIGKIAVDVQKWTADLLSMSAHKVYGPKGCGCLYVRGGPRTIPINPLMFGGGQEANLRPGTLNVPGIVGMGEAFRLAGSAMQHELPVIKTLRDRFESLLQQSMPSLWVNAKSAHRLPNTSSISVPSVDADAILLRLPHLALGTGSACTTGAVEPSHVLQAIGLSRENAGSTIRVSFGRFNRASDVETAVVGLTGQIAELLASVT